MMNLQQTDDLFAKCKSLIASGRLVEAVKLYRFSTKCSLKTAMDVLAPLRNSFQPTVHTEKSDLIRAALLAYAKTTLGRERSLCEQLAAQAEVMADSVQ